MKLFVAASLLASLLGAQNGAGGFQEFSIRASASGEESVRIKGNKLEARNATLRQLLQIAYNLPAASISGPPLLDVMTYDVHAVPPDGQINTVRTLLRGALANSFRLSSHLQKRPVEGYALTLIPGTQPKLGPAGSGPGTVPDSGTGGHIGAKAANMDVLAAELSHWLEKPVFNETGLKGRYGFDLTWGANDERSLNTAIRNQLGLQIALVSRQLDVLIIDHVESLQGQP